MKKFISILFLFALLFTLKTEVKAQPSGVRDFLSVLGITSDTITNNATTNLKIHNPGPASQTTVIQVEVEEISGTGAGTLTLYASIDGNDFNKAILPTDTTLQVLYNTHTVADATGTQVFFWLIENNPYNYYQVRHSGGTTMSYKFRAKLLSHR
jgi:hypothetical protein